jgi:hypothetical protein
MSIVFLMKGHRVLTLIPSRSPHRGHQSENISTAGPSLEVEQRLKKPLGREGSCLRVVAADLGAVDLEEAGMSAAKRRAPTGTPQNGIPRNASTCRAGSRRGRPGCLHVRTSFLPPPSRAASASRTRLASMASLRDSARKAAMTSSVRSKPAICRPNRWGSIPRCARTARWRGPQQLGERLHDPA